MKPPRTLAVLVGNGLSTAFNPDLTIPRINTEIVNRLNFPGTGGTTQARVMQQVAQNLGQGSGDPYSDFEALLGPFDQQSDSLKMLRQLADLAGPHSLLVGNALTLSAQFIDELRRYGVGHALDIIATRSRAEQHLIGKVHAFITNVVMSANGGRITFGNLNYDSLIMAALCELYGPDLCDMTDGRFATEMHEVVPGIGYSIPGKPLRVVGDYPNRTITLLHLHGSLTWLRMPGTTGPQGIYRFDLGPLRTVDYWTAWREGRTSWSPEVVLTNQTTKDTLVKDYPFSLAYDSFYNRLLTADRWLVVGYSFRDGCVNELMARAWAHRKAAPPVMVVTKGKGPTDDEVLTALGFDADVDPLPSHWLHTWRGGLESAPASGAWATWTAQTASAA